MEKKRVSNILIAVMGPSSCITAEDILIEEQSDIIVFANKKELKGGLQQFAEHLIQRDIKEIHKLALMLKEEYGIEVASIPIAMPLGDVDGYDIRQVCLNVCSSQKKDYHVPKKIGKICGRPKGKYRK